MKTAEKQPRRWEAMGPILACGDTNAAVDNLVEGLLHKRLRVVRLGQPAKVGGAEAGRWQVAATYVGACAVLHSCEQGAAGHQLQWCGWASLSR